MRQTEILATTPFRRRARKMERELQDWLDNGQGVKPPPSWIGYAVPSWAEGARVEKAGRFSWAVVATSTRGH